MVGPSNGGLSVIKRSSTVKRIGELNTLERRLVRRIMETKRINIKTPFTAQQILDAIEADLTESRCTLRYLPNKYKMNYLLRKSKKFTCDKAAKKGINMWVLTHKEV
jgi:hypothetical protein